MAGGNIEKLIERNRSIRNGNTPYEDKEWLRSRYVDNLMSLRDISKEANCGLRTMARWMLIHGIETRKGKDIIRKDTSGANNPNWKDNIKFKKTVCACGGRKNYSALRCKFCFYKANSGEGNYNYKGLANIMVSIRAYIAIKWRPIVYTRDSYTCQHCGDSRGRNLHAHHIKPLSEIVKNKFEEIKPDIKSREERLKFISTLCSDIEINDITNGITLCEDCHKQEHKSVKYKHPLPRMYLKIKEENNVYV